eukprot:10345526-Lingulodinium_polyedra.AAC.1
MVGPRVSVGRAGASRRANATTVPRCSTGFSTPYAVACHWLSSWRRATARRPTSRASGGRPALA